MSETKQVFPSEYYNSAHPEWARNAIWQVAVAVWHHMDQTSGSHAADAVESVVLKTFKRFSPTAPPAPDLWEAAIEAAAKAALDSIIATGKGTPLGTPYTDLQRAACAAAAIRALKESDAPVSDRRYPLMKARKEILRLLEGVRVRGEVDHILQQAEISITRPANDSSLWEAGRDAAATVALGYGGNSYEDEKLCEAIARVEQDGSVAKGAMAAAKRWFRKTRNYAEDNRARTGGSFADAALAALDAAEIEMARIIEEEIGRTQTTATASGPAESSTLLGYEAGVAAERQRIREATDTKNEGGTRVA